MYEICPTFFFRSCQLQQTLWVLLLIYFQLSDGQSKTPPRVSYFLIFCCDMNFPFFPPSPSAAYRPSAAQSSHPSPRCHVNNYWSLLLPAPSRSSLTFSNPKHLPGVFNTSWVLGPPRRWRKHTPSSSQLLLSTCLRTSWRWQPGLYSQCSPFPSSLAKAHFL